MIVESEKSGDAKGKVYKELFEEGTIDYRNVADFLTEFEANVFPKDFHANCGYFFRGIFARAIATCGIVNRGLSHRANGGRPVQFMPLRIIH